MIDKERTVEPRRDEPEFPAHLYEPIRHDIAVMLWEKEQLKLHPDFTAGQRAAMGADMQGWFEGTHYGLAPVLDFWDTFESTLDGMKLKKLTPLLTAGNIQWQQTDLPLDGDRAVQFLIPLSAFGMESEELNPSANRLRELLQDPAVRAAQQVNSAAHSYPPRDDHPIVVVQEGDNLTVRDGNRRLRDAVLRGTNTLPAYVGTYKGEERRPRDYWISPHFFQALMGPLESQLQSNPEQADQIMAHVEQIIFMFADDTEVVWPVLKRALWPNYTEYYGYLRQRYGQHLATKAND